MEIRKAELQDLERIKDLYTQLNVEQASYQPEVVNPVCPEEEFMVDMISGKTSDILVAEENGSVVGMAVVLRLYTPPYRAVTTHRYAKLMDLAVEETQRGRGTGKRLLEAVNDWAKAQELEYVELMVLEKNQGAMRLYQEMGYQSMMRTMWRSLTKE